MPRTTAPRRLSSPIVASEGIVKRGVGRATAFGAAVAVDVDVDVGSEYCTPGAASTGVSSARDENKSKECILKLYTSCVSRMSGG